MIGVDKPVVHNGAPVGVYVNEANQIIPPLTPGSRFVIFTVKESICRFDSGTPMHDY